MRFAGLVSAVIAFILSGSSFAQTWVEFFTVEDRFGILFPSEPTAEEIAYTMIDGRALPARRYFVENSDGYYAVTSINLATAYEAHTTTVDGSIAHAATSYRQRGEVTYDAYARYDRMPGHKLQLTEPDGRRTFVSIILHQDQDMEARRLYIVEATVPGGSTPPILLQGSFSVIDEDLNRVSYEFNADGNRYRVIPGSGGIPLPE